MITTLRFTDDEKHELMVAMKAGDMACVLTEIKDLLRAQLKYGFEPNVPKERDEYVEWLRARFYELVSEYDLNRILE